MIMKKALLISSLAIIASCTDNTNQMNSSQINTSPEPVHSSESCEAVASYFEKTALANYAIVNIDEGVIESEQITISRINNNTFKSGEADMELVEFSSLRTILNEKFPEVGEDLADEIADEILHESKCAFIPVGQLDATDADTIFEYAEYWTSIEVTTESEIFDQNGDFPQTVEHIRLSSRDSDEDFITITAIKQNTSSSTDLVDKTFCRETEPVFGAPVGTKVCLEFKSEDSLVDTHPRAFGNPSFTTSYIIVEDSVLVAIGEIQTDVYKIENNGTVLRDENNAIYDLELPEPRRCTREAGELYHPTTGQCSFYSDGCQKADLMGEGFIHAPEDKCNSVIMP